LLEALQGAIVYRVRDDLSDRLRVGARNLQSARIIAGAIIEGQKTMALKDKFARLAERTRTVPAALSDMADKTLADFDGVEKEGGDAFAAMDTVVADAKAAVAVAKDAVAQLTNSPPSD
jgi:hypothetical protein